MAPSGSRPSRLPRIFGWIAFAAVILLLGPIAFAVVMLKSGPDVEGTDPIAKLFVAALVLAVAAAAGWLARTLAALILKLLRRRT